MFYRATSAKKTSSFFALILHHIPTKCSILRPLLSSTFPKEFQIFKTFGLLDQIGPVGRFDEKNDLNAFYHCLKGKQMVIAPTINKYTTSNETVLCYVLCRIGHCMEYRQPGWSRWSGWSLVMRIIRILRGLGGNIIFFIPCSHFFWKLSDCS